MALPNTIRPLGLRECDVTVYGGANGLTLGTPVKLPGAQTITVEPQADEVTVEGEDQILETAEVRKRAAVSGNAAGFSPEAVAAITGGTLTTTGVTPNQKKSLVINKDDKRPYVRVRGRQVTANGLSDLVTVVHYARFINGPSTGGDQGTFAASGFSGTAIPHPTTGDVIGYEYNETAAALPGT